MPSLYDTLNEADDGETMAMLGRQFGLTPAETEAAVIALLPAISTGLKHSTATPEGLGNLFDMMGQQRDLQSIGTDPKVAFTREGRAAGDDLLSVIFGSPDVSRAVADQAEQFSGIGSSVLKKMLPVLAGILISNLMGGKSGQAAPQAPSPRSRGDTGGGLGGDLGGSLGDILGQVFGREAGTAPRPQPSPGNQRVPVPTDSADQTVPGGDLLGYVLREFEKGIREGHIKPVIVDDGSVQVPMPGGQRGPLQIPEMGGPSERIPSQAPGGDVLGQILRDMLGGGSQRAPQRPEQSPQMKDLSDLSKQLGFTGLGAALFGDRLEVGREVDQDHLDNIQSALERAYGGGRR